MQYARSGTALDQAGAFMPQKLLGIGRFSGRVAGVRGMRAVRGLGSLGDFFDDWSGDTGAYAGLDPAPYFPTDPSNYYATDPTYYPAYTPPPVVAAPPATVTPSSASDFNWSQIPAAVRDIVTAYGGVQSAQAQTALQQLNLQRAAQGLPAINPAAYGVGVRYNPLAPRTIGAPGTIMGFSFGTIGLGVAGLYFLTRKSARR